MGQAEAQSMLPSVYQPQGKAKATNPWQGALDTVCDQLLDLAGQVKDSGGDKVREVSVVLQKCAYEIAKQNNNLSKLAQGEQDDA